MRTIPKVMNFFWHSGNISWLRCTSIQSFKKHNPDWEVVLNIFKSDNMVAPWVDHNIQDFQAKHDDYLHTIRKDAKLVEWKPDDWMPKNMCPSQASNFFKFSHLGRAGGFYADMDMLFTRSIDDLYKEALNYDIGVTFMGYFAVGLLFSTAESSAYLDITRDMAYRFNKKTYQGAWIDTFQNMVNVDGMSRDYNCSVLNMNPEYFYHLDWTQIPSLWNEDLFKEYPKETMGIHWHAACEESQHWNKTLTPNNYFEFNNTITSALKATFYD